MDKKEQWADETLNSLQSVKRATPNDDLFDKIITEIQNKKENKIISLKQMAWITVAASVIIAVNIYALKLQKDTLNNMAESTENQTSLLSDYTF